MNREKPEVDSDPFDWLPAAMAALAMYAPDGEFAGSEIPSDEAGRKAIWICHQGKFMKVQLGGYPDLRMPETTQPKN
ncbi:hypothetical protein ACFFKC_08530 [Pseudoduganella danionis]|uniref:Uncharacterized protein n=2 Tax=Pseudoduganella danionis TaxID=1890295 RepID=A0ABW9SRT6_9BURK|nr:hypothetical protein [Pseudoduganella danionis]MTW34877.1 hypothetical protein [Pseudoduganella danionis]